MNGGFFLKVFLIVIGAGSALLNGHSCGSGERYAVLCDVLHFERGNFNEWWLRFCFVNNGL